MSAVAGFRFYYVDDAVFRSIAGSLADKYGYANYFDGYYCRTQTRGGWQAHVLRAITYLYDCPTGETYIDLAELLKDRDYYIVTTNQDAQFYRVFPEDKITRLQGDFRYFQCKNRCHDEIYYNRDMVMELVPQIKGDKLPEGLWPICPKCGGEMEPWVRGPNFLEGSFYQKEIARYLDALIRRWIEDYWPSAVMKNLLRIVGDKDYFIVASNGDTHLEISGFAPEKVWEIEGTFLSTAGNAPIPDKSRQLREFIDSR